MTLAELLRDYLPPFRVREDGGFGGQVLVVDSLGRWVHGYVLTIADRVEALAWAHAACDCYNATPLQATLPGVLHAER